MTAVVPDSPALRAELRELAPKVVMKPHPWIGRRMLILRGATAEGARLVADLVERFGSCWWARGRWRVRRAQMRLPGF